MISLRGIQRWRVLGWRVLRRVCVFFACFCEFVGGRDVCHASVGVRFGGMEGGELRRWVCSDCLCGIE